ncbi:uncharacterized protein BXZ73DRAFT_101212 [Epithele typhae]|uniref:uncharacterized protein n=1 Tax=Epithele typhae TaxID=378194 RepID=UPI002008C34C|nr:uncharacterized protein BXZ73DRAFT_101212 [Epithele typhae]KAH9933252.1 hypothetical protein BXZ73DRAFT_101212 [Epithele typhae]
MGSIDSTFGAALIGLVVGACLYGITLLQTFSYFRNYSDDTRFTKSLVIILTLLDTLHVTLCTRTIYWYLVTNFTNTDNLDVTTWSMALQTDCNGLIGLIVEWFFARRVWMMSQNRFITGIIIILASVHFGLGVVFTIDSFILGRFSKFANLTWVTCVGLGSAAASDILIAVAMCYYLYSKRTGLKKTDSVVTTLMVYSINSGLTTSVIATICVVTFAAMPTNFVWLSFFWIMGKCYVNSFLALLNSREGLRDKFGTGAVQLSDFAASPHSAQHGSYPDLPHKNVHRSPARTRLDGVSVQIETVTDFVEANYPQSSRTVRRLEHGCPDGRDHGAQGRTHVLSREDATSVSSVSPV